jgi:GAF domain-containing protein
VQGTLSELAVPIKIEDRVLGVLNVEHPEPHAFDEHDQQLLEAIASHAATAIHNAKLYQARQTVNQVGQRLTGGIRMKEDKILDLIHSQASELMDTNNMYIALYDNATDVVRFGLAFVDGERVEVEKEEKWRPRRGGRGRTEWIVHNRDPIFIPTEAESKAWYEQPGCQEYIGEEFASWIGVPMIVGDRVLGVIATYHPDRDHVYSEDDLEILQAMADQAAIALDNANLFYNVNRKLVALSEFQQAIASDIRMEEGAIVKLIHDQASELINTDNMYIALYDEETDTVRFPLAFSAGKRIDVDARSGGKGRTEWIIRNRESIFVSTQEEGEEWYDQPGHEEYVGEISSSWVGVPMEFGDSVLGVIATYHPVKEYLYTGDDLEILQTMADQAAVAFTNARLLQQERHRVSQLNTLYEVGQEVNRTLDVNKILPRILREAMELTGTDSGVVHLLGRNGGFERSYSYPPESEHPEPRLTEGTMTHTIMETGEPLVVPDTGHSPYVRKEMVNSGVRSIVGVPLTLLDEVIGVFYLNATEPKDFTEEDQDLLGALADQAAVAIENARLYQEARDEVQATRQLSTLGTAIAALQHRINNTFNIIVPNMTRLRKRVDTSDPTIEEILDIVERNARYTSEIIERIQEPLGEVEFQDVDINSVLTDVAGRIEEDEGSSIDVQLVLDDSIPLFSAPIGQITEIFQNLADNACRIMDDGGELRITSSLVDEGIEVRVEDTGPGISPKIQERLFVKPVPSKEPGGGSGLGLWLSGLMLKSFGGKIGVEETSPAGTTMLVTIPIAGAGRGDSQ